MATVGEANYENEKLLSLLDEGASIFRFNAAHIKTSSSEGGELHGQFGFGNVSVESVLEQIRRYEVERQQPITTYLDLAGPKIRVEEIIGLHQRFADIAKAVPGKKALWDNLEAMPLNYYPNHPRIKDLVKIYIEEPPRNEGGSVLRKNHPIINGISTGKHLSEHFEAIIKSCSHYWWSIRLQLDNLRQLHKGAEINFKDGLCRVTVRDTKVDEDNVPYLECEVTDVNDSFLFMAEQGANPKNYLFSKILTDKDIRDLAWGLKCGFDVISVSFVCSPLEAFQVRHQIREFNRGRESPVQPLVFAKIETGFSVDPALAQRFAKENDLKNWGRYGQFFSDEKEWNDYLEMLTLYEKNPIVAICEAFDGVMVARGDLAVEADKYDVPSFQEAIIRSARMRAKPVIVATEVLESMKEERPATRAEIGDIRNSVDDGADIIMLSGEVASTRRKNPADVVREARLAIEAAERGSRSKELLKNFDSLRDAQIAHLEEFDLHDSANAERISLGTRICNAGAAKRSEVVIVSATSGVAARYVSFLQPAQRIVAVTHDLGLARHLVLSKGVYPFVLQNQVQKELEDFILATRAIHIANHIAPSIDDETASLKRSKRARDADGENAGKKPKLFVVPGLLRTMSKYAPSEHKSENGVNLPNTMFDFELSTEPGYPEEREIKYVLSPSSYERLASYLRDDSGSKSRTSARHWNFYYYDDQGGFSKSRDDLVSAFSATTKSQISQTSAIFRAKGMVRIRIVDQIGESGSILDSAIFLTLKSEGLIADDGDTESRPELEYDVTQYLLPIIGGGRDSRSLQSFSDRWQTVWEALPSHFFKEIVRRFNIESEGLHKPISELRLIPLCHSENMRLTAHIYGELVLELDQYRTGGENIYHELEIETFEPDEPRRNEYIHLLFSALDIPIVTARKYPSKVLRAMCDHGIIELEDASKAAMAQANAQIQIKHRESCPDCQKLKLHYNDKS
jgi:pyruvate kinase